MTTPTIRRPRRSPTAHQNEQPRPVVAADDPLLTVPEVAERLNTTERYPRRLIAERRITFVRIGRHVRIPASEVEALIAAGVVEPARHPVRPAAVA